MNYTLHLLEQDEWEEYQALKHDRATIEAGADRLHRDVDEARDWACRMYRAARAAAAAWRALRALRQWENEPIYHDGVIATQRALVDARTWPQYREYQERHLKYIAAAEAAGEALAELGL